MKRVSEMDVKLIQRVNIHFCVKLGWSHAETRRALIIVFGADVLSWPMTKAWHDSFSQGRTTLVDLQRAPKRKSGRNQNNVQAVKNLLDNDRTLTVAAIHRQTGVSHSSVWRIIRKDLGLALKCAAFVPAFLTPRHVVDQFQHCQAMLNVSRFSPSTLKKIVTMDEAWFYQYDPERKRQSSRSHPMRLLALPSAEEGNPWLCVSFPGRSGGSSAATNC